MSNIVQRIRTVLNSGGNVNTRNTRTGDTLLISLLNSARLYTTRIVETLVRELLARGASVNVHNSFGYTPLMAAVLTGSTDLVRMLIQAGANVNARRPNGYSALTYAFAEQYTEIAQLLIRAGAKVEKVNLKEAVATNTFGPEKNNKLLVKAMYGLSGRHRLRKAVEAYRRRKATNLLKSPHLFGNLTRTSNLPHLTPNVIKLIGQRLQTRMVQPMNRSNQSSEPNRANYNSNQNYINALKRYWRKWGGPSNENAAIARRLKKNNMNTI